MPARIPLKGVKLDIVHCERREPGKLWGFQGPCYGPLLQDAAGPYSGHVRGFMYEQEMLCKYEHWTPFCQFLGAHASDPTSLARRVGPCLWECCPIDWRV